MKFGSIAAALLPAITTTAAYSHEDYASGRVMSLMMDAKEAAWAAARARGDYESRKWFGFDKKRNGKGKIPCKNGVVEAVKGDPDQTYRCKNMDLYDYKTHDELGSSGGEGSGSWGWTYGKREFIAIGQTDGAAFAEITKDGKFSYLGRLPAQKSPTIWREMKAMGDYMIIGSEGEGHGVQIFDMKKLLKANPKRPTTWSTVPGKDISLFTDLPIGRSHTITVNEEKRYAVANGAAPRNSTCAAGLIFINLDDPNKPYSPGCASQDGYVHDAQCIVYRGPDKKYNGRDICYGYNEDTLTIYDVTNKTGTNAATVISRSPYKGNTYTHQGWVLDPMWQTHLVMDDEIDEGIVDTPNPESPAKDGFCVTYIWDITSLEKPKNTGYYKSGTRSIDHNQYVYDGLSYQSNYQAGMRVLDVSSIPRQPSGKDVKEIAYFDVYPPDDKEPGGGIATWDHGTWSAYTFPSGYIVVNTIDRGPFVIKMTNHAKRGFGKEFVRRA